MPETIIFFDQLDCAYYIRKSRLSVARVEVLRALNLALHRGETLGIIGSNGAGKSTLLQVLARILLPTGGSAWFRERLTISLLTLQLGFAPELSGRENAILGAMYLGYSRKDAVARLDSILEFAELGNWADEPVRTYSSGMAARLGFAVAMEMSPDVMLIDEVLGVGDAYFQKKSSEALKAKMRSGQTTVLVSHSDQALRTLCTRAVWLRDGTICMEGDPGEVSDAYYHWVASLDKETAGAP